MQLNWVEVISSEVPVGFYCCVGGTGFFIGRVMIIAGDQAKAVSSIILWLNICKPVGAVAGVT